jgi:hypothetical protein
MICARWRDSIFAQISRYIILPSVVEPEPQGAKTFGQSWSLYSEVSAPAPGSVSD